MKKALVKMTALLLVLLLLTGCSSGGPGETKDDPAKKTQASAETENPAESTTEESTPADSTAEETTPADSTTEESKPAETAETESREPSPEETKEETPADLYRKAVRISEETHYRETGAYGIFDHFLGDARVAYDQVFLYFSDRQYCLQPGNDSSGEPANVSLHSNGHNWTTTYDYSPSLPLKKLSISDTDSDLVPAYFFSLSYLADEVEEAPEQVEYNGVSCLRFTVTEAASSLYPEGSVERTWRLFRQEDLIFVYGRRDVVTPDGTEIPIIERRIMSGKETEEFYQDHAQDFADVERRDSRGSWTLTMVIDPDEENERTYRVPMNAGEDLRSLIVGYTPYRDREGTIKIDLETGSAELKALTDSAADTTIYLISNKKKGDPAPTEPATEPVVTTESTSPDPGTAADLPNGYYAIWTYVNNSEELFSQYERYYDALVIDHTEGEEVTVTQKSNGLYIKLTKDHFETTFPLDGENGQTYYRKEGELVRVPVSSEIQEDLAQYISIVEWIFTEGAYELFCIYVQDGVAVFIGTVS